MNYLFLDIETFSSIDIKESGDYRYMQSPDFEILLVSFALNDEEVTVIDWYNSIPDLFEGDPLYVNQIFPDHAKFLIHLMDENTIKVAHNAAFERQAFKRIGYNIPVDQWRCTMVMSAYCGLVLDLDSVSKILNLGANAKLATGTKLLNFFAKPCKPTNKNGFRTRNLKEHDLQNWTAFKQYATNDTKAAREIFKILSKYPLPDQEWIYYQLDQKINDRGIRVDLNFAYNANKIDLIEQEKAIEQLKQVTGLDNPNSDAQMKAWLSDVSGVQVKSLAKESIEPMIEAFGAGAVSDVLNLRKKIAKKSTSKYNKMLSSACEDERLRGMLQFYGANRTGRWAGKLVQLHNLPQNHLKDLDVCRQIIAKGDPELANISFDNLGVILSQLIRTTFIPKEGHLFAVADFSAIEGRVGAWLAGEDWKTEVFRTHGKIYEASASMMFGVPIDQITKDSPLRQRGKIAELALQYGGSTGALANMEKAVLAGQSLDETQRQEIVQRYRRANPKIVELWSRLDKAAKRTMETQRPVKVECLTFLYDGTYLTIELPSKRKLFYYRPYLASNKFGGQSIHYYGQNQDTKQWTGVDTWGGKWLENVVQGISRDLLAESMLKLDKAGFDLVIHVHDENVAEVPTEKAVQGLKEMCEIMSVTPDWAPGLPLKAEGFINNYYKK